MFQGAKRLIESGIVQNIFLETSPSRKSPAVEEMLVFLVKAGYDLFQYGTFRGPQWQLPDDMPQMKSAQMFNLGVLFN